MRESQPGSRWRAAVLAAAAVAAGGGCGSGGATGPLGTDEAVAACVVYASCAGGSAGSCFATILPTLDEQQARCLAGASGDCLGAARCLGTTISLGHTCDPDEYSCSGSKQVLCTGAGTTYMDCAEVPQAGGPTCVMGTSGRPMCGLGSCAASEIACEGDVLVQCYATEGVKLAMMDCAAQGLVCATMGESAACVGAGADCSIVGNRCDGATLLSCVGGKEGARDCAAYLRDATCLTGTDVTGCLLGTECDPLQTVDTCDGDTLTFCAAGLQKIVDCGSYGFGSCVDGRCQAYPTS